MGHYFYDRTSSFLVKVFAIMAFGTLSTTSSIAEESVTDWLKQEPVSRWHYGLEKLNAYLADRDQHRSLPEDLVYSVTVKPANLGSDAGINNDLIKIWARSADAYNLIDYEKGRCERYIRQIKKDAGIDQIKEFNIRSDYARFFGYSFWDEAVKIHDRPRDLKEVDQLFVVEVVLTDAYCTSHLLSDDIKHFSITGRPL